MVNVAILGFGTVGSGVAEVLEGHAGSIAGRVQIPIRVKYILDVRAPEGPFADRFVGDFSVIEQDGSVDIVVETIGGTGAALDFTRRALTAGKSVVTSNKELVAEHGYELLELARAHRVSYLFEASVGGGIPIIRPLAECLAANEILEICGILNGTTNYILTRMIGAGLTFEDALREAQENGYAERDPSADVDGHDACRKICILADIAFGRQIFPRQVPTEGIRGVTLADADYAAAAGMRVKLLGRALRMADGRVCAYVAPHMVPCGHPLAGVEDVFNAITVRGDAIGDVMFYGRGAGKLPTASAVAGDVIDAARHMGAPKYLAWAEGGENIVAPADELPCRWYLRVNAPESALAGLGNVICIAAAAGGEGAYLTEGAFSHADLARRLGSLVPGSAFRVLN